MVAPKPQYNPLWRAVVLLVLISAIAIGLFVMMIGAFNHDESHEQHDIRKAFEELQNSRTK